jgi:alkanesulfonate monooxygenase
MSGEGTETAADIDLSHDVRQGVELIGMIGVQPETRTPGARTGVIGGSVDPQYLRRFAQAHEESGFDTVLIGYASTAAEGFTVAGYAAAATERLRFLIAHRPGFVAPTLAARTAATLDHLTGGRIALHIISGGNDAEQQRDGDWLDHDARYRRTDEYLDVVRRG